MALRCVCYPVKDPRVQTPVQKAQNDNQRVCRDPKTEKKVDICEIVKRTRDNEETKHNERECHLRGETRQNLINKLKMFLDDCDDRPVMKTRGKGGDLPGKGQTGFGPMIKYPGYVDYDHPYFSEPYNRLPELAQTVGQRPGVNPCPPISVRNFEATMNNQSSALNTKGGEDPAYNSQGRGRGEGCQCAKRRGVPPECPAARGF